MIASRFAPVRGALLCTLLLLCSGCSPTASSPGTPSPQTSAPNFSGPHSELFREVWAKESQPKVHTIIGDEAVTELEWNEVQQDFTSCIAEHGMSVSEITLGGGFNVKYLTTAPDVGDRAIDTCQSSSGLIGVGLLYSEQVTNPNNEDFAVLMSACLVRAQVVQPDYSADDWRRETATLSDGPWYELSYVVSQAQGRDAANACAEDPTHAFQK